MQLVIQCHWWYNANSLTRSSKEGRPSWAKRGLRSVMTPVGLPICPVPCINYDTSLPICPVPCIHYDTGLPICPVPCINTPNQLTMLCTRTKLHKQNNNNKEKKKVLTFFFSLLLFVFCCCCCCCLYVVVFFGVWGGFSLLLLLLLFVCFYLFFSEWDICIHWPHWKKNGVYQRWNHGESSGCTRMNISRFPGPWWYYPVPDGTTRSLVVLPESLVVLTQWLMVLPCPWWYYLSLW